MALDVIIPADLGAVAGKLYQVRAVWRNLGFELLIGKDQLAAIAQEGGDERDHLRSVLRHWLNTQPSQRTPPTWAALRNALRNIGKESLARKLEYKPCKHIVYTSVYSYMY